MSDYFYKYKQYLRFDYMFIDYLKKYILSL